MNCNYELTKDRVERAIEVIETIAEASEQEYRIADANMSTSFDYDLYEKYTEAFETCIAALDAVRWRKPSEELPECFEIVLIYNGEGVHPCEYVNAYDDPDVAIWRLYGHDDKYCWTTDEIVAWLPLLMWED